MSISLVSEYIFNSIDTLQLTTVICTNSIDFELTLVRVTLLTSVVVLTIIVDIASTTRATMSVARVFSNNESLRITFRCWRHFASTGTTT
jgi:hypothetical protein